MSDSIMQTEKEEWRDIPGYEGLYRVSSFGRIESLRKKGSRGCIVKQQVSDSGYMTVMLYKNTSRKPIRVHRVVALAFLGDSDLDVNHKDGDKANNRVSNLEYCTRSQNVSHAIRIGLFSPDTSKAVQAKKKRVSCSNGVVYESVMDASRKLGVSFSGVSQCCRGKLKSLHGYRFEFESERLA